MVITDAEPDRLAPLTPPAPIGLRGVWVVAARCCASPAARCCADAVERSFACPSSELPCRVHGGTIQTRDSYCGSPLAAAPARQGREVPLIHMSSDLGLTTAHPAQSSSPVPGQSTPFARQVRASRPPLLRMRSLSTDSLLAARFVWPRPLFCRYISARNDIQGEHLERRPGSSNAPNHAQAAALISWS